MKFRVAALLGVSSVVATSCFVPDDATPRVALSADLATKFVHRGMTNVDKPVVQPRMAVELPTESGDRMHFVAGGTIELSNDTGGAWFPDGHAGRFTQIDLFADYEKQLGDVFTVRAGIFSYNFPNGLEFLNGERGSTTEVFTILSANVLEATPYLAWHYDFDEVRAAYYRGGITESFELAQDLTLVLDGSLGYTASSQALWMYGIDESGWADLQGSATVLYQYDGRTQLSAGVHGSYMVDSAYRNWFPQIAAQGVDPDPIWFVLGVRWSF
jgi:hypothetical protein